MTLQAQNRRNESRAIGPVKLLVLGFSKPDFHDEIIAEPERPSTLDLVEIGLVTAEEAEQLHAIERGNKSAPKEVRT